MQTVCIGTGLKLDGKSSTQMLQSHTGAMMVVGLALNLPVLAMGQMGDGSPAVALGNARMVRGTVTATAANRLTVKTETGELFDVVVTPNTQVRKGRDAMKLVDVRAGDGIGAMGEIDAAKKTVHALFVTVVYADELKKAREAMGKTVISGTVTAINGLKLTIKRTDDVVQVIQVDEDTSFRKGGRAMGMALGADAANFGWRAWAKERTGFRAHSRERRKPDPRGRKGWKRSGGQRYDQERNICADRAGNQRPGSPAPAENGCGWNERSDNACKSDSCKSKFCKSGYGA